MWQSLLANKLPIKQHRRKRLFHTPPTVHLWKNAEKILFVVLSNRGSRVCQNWLVKLNGSTTCAVHATYLCFQMQ